MKYLIVGLGNIGDEYAETRHNIGFKILDAFAEASNILFTDARYGSVATCKLKGHVLTAFLQPLMPLLEVPVRELAAQVT